MTFYFIFSNTIFHPPFNILSNIIINYYHTNHVLSNLYSKYYLIIFFIKIFDSSNFFRFIRLAELKIREPISSSLTIKSTGVSADWPSLATELNQSLQRIFRTANHSKRIFVLTNHWIENCKFLCLIIFMIDLLSNQMIIFKKMYYTIIFIWFKNIT